MTEPSTSDRFIATPRGRLFARLWEPVAESRRAPIILVHDSLGSVEQWRDFPARLAAATTRPVIAYDRLGFGRSDPRTDKLSTDFVRSEASTGMAAIREAFAVDHMILLGHSVGGGMSVCAAGTYPEVTDGVITIAAQAFVEARTITGIEEARDAFSASPDMMARLARYHGDKASWVLNAWIETWLSEAFADWTLDADLTRVRCPLLALHGDLDEYGSRAHPDRIAALAGGPARAVLLAGCHHVPHREMPDEVVRLVAEFAAEL